MQILECNSLRGIKLLSAISLSAAMAAALLGAGCSKKGDDDESSNAPAAPAQVTVTQVTRSDISQILQITGTVAAVPNRDVKVSALVAGHITEMNVAEGDRVTDGEIIARLDDRTYRDQLTQAQATEAQAQANFDNAKLNAARNQDLVQRGIAARKDLEDAQTELSVTQAALRQAQAAVSTAQLQLTRTEVKSPINGLVVKKFVSGGEQVDGTAATPIAEIADLGEVEVLANVPPSDLPHLRIGEAVQLASATLAGQKFTGHVIAISPAVDPQTNTGSARIRVPNPSGELRLGMFLATQIPAQTVKQALTVPAQSIYRDEDGNPRVFVVSGDTATSTPVTLGIQTSDRVQIASGVKQGDTIILTGGYGLGDKSKIEIQKPQAATPPGADKDDKDK
jgi:RND family efflux transporter MFP subunit